MKKVLIQTDAFKIAHYILLFFVVVLCIALVSWAMFSARDSEFVTASPRFNTSNPCVKRVKDAVTQMWEYEPTLVPQKYWRMVSDYADSVLPARASVPCDGRSYVCLAGQMRRDCDPCALMSGRQYAISVHISDMVHQLCMHPDNM